MSVRTGSDCVLDATVIVSVTSLAAGTRGKIFEKVVVAVVVEAITSLPDDDGFLMKSSVEK